MYYSVVTTIHVVIHVHIHVVIHVHVHIIDLVKLYNVIPVHVVYIVFNLPLEMPSFLHQWC